MLSRNDLEQIKQSVDREFEIINNPDSLDLSCFEDEKENGNSYKPNMNYISYEGEQ